MPPPASDHRLIPESTIAEILERVDVVQLIGRQVALRKAGTLFKGLCPFHQEKSPSFTVSPVRRTYHCFGCGAHGDAVRFLIEQGGRTFPEAVRELAAEVGIEVPEERPPSPEKLVERAREKTRAEHLFAVQEAVTRYFVDSLFGPTGEPARRYLQKRGFSVESAQAFRLGYADGDRARFEAFARSAGLSVADLEALGLLLVGDSGPDDGPLEGRYPRFRRRLMCPVIDVKGRVTGYSGRVIDADAKGGKYVNSPETPLFIKGEQLYGAHTARATARQAGRVLLCEGNLDVISLWQAGFPGSVAAMGTALTPKQVRLVKRLADEVICVMDGDAAGAKAAFASLMPFLEEGVQPRAVMLTGGHDPDSYLRAHGIEAFRTLLDTAQPLFDLVIEKEARTHPADALGRVAALRAIAPALRLITDPLARDLYHQQICARLGVGPDFLNRALQEAEAPPARPAERAAERPAPRPSERVGPGRTPERTPERTPDHPWDPQDVPPGDPPPPDLRDLAPDRLPPPVGPDPTPRRKVLRPMPAIPRYERELAEYIADFPNLAVDFVQRQGTRYLTHSGLADFLVRLCAEVESGAVLDEDRLLREFPDAQVVAFWRERQARRSGLDPERARRALHDGLLQAEKGYLVRRRDTLKEQLLRERSPALQAEFAEVQRQITMIARRLSTPTNQPPAEGAN